MSSDDVGKAIEIIRKQGKAWVTVTVVPHATDAEFKDNSPSCRVTVTISDPADPGKVFPAQTADIATNGAPPYSHRFTVSVETVVSSFFGIFGRRRRSLAIDITAEPINGYEALYEADSVRLERVQAGSNEPRNVSLKPKPNRQLPLKGKER